MSHASEYASILWFVVSIGALLLLFVAAQRVPIPPIGWSRLCVRAALIAAAIAVTILANVALYKHDTHLDFTREKAFTPSPDTEKVVRALDQDVELYYFYQKQNPAGRLAKTLVEIMGKMNPRLKVQTIDPDQNPALATRFGVKVFNTALLVANGQRLEIASTDDREIALGIVRLLRRDARPVCFSVGHGEYDIDNFEFHTHFEGQNAHSHDMQGMAIVQMEQHGIGRLRRALEKLGYGAQKVSLATQGKVPEACSVLIIANPRTRFGPPEIAQVESYLANGGRLMMLVEPDYEIDTPLAALLKKTGLSIEPGIVSDPNSHYYTDEQMVAVSQYAPHPATVGLALSFYPGIRPLKLQPREGVQSKVLLSSSASSRVMENRIGGNANASKVATGPIPLVIASEGILSSAQVAGDAASSSAKLNSKTFRVAVVGDADFASNSFFPYLANADLALGMIAWLRGEDRGPAVKPPVEVLPTVILTNDQMTGIFLVTVLLLPGLLGLAGALVWWRRRY